MPTAADDVLTLAIDIGGSGLKMLTLDANGEALTERLRVATPKKATPEAVLKVLDEMIAKHGAFDRISVGFPGVVTGGVIFTAVNLDKSWVGFDLAKALQERTGRPVRVANDADVQGLGVVEGRGVELVLTLGTGMGSALFVNGRLVPNLELGHHPFRKDRTYEDLVGDAALKKIGAERWSRRVRKAIDALEETFNYRLLYLGGGNAEKLDTELPKNVKIVSNLAGLLGGIALWRD
jgi:polyphosphate glucokinase